jgi:eukaryotic-like serine/threonine-protein kinase
MSDRIRFGFYELDRDARELRKRGELIRLQDQPFRVLALLTERPGETITREELQQQIWGKETFVDFDQSLNKAVNRIREALADDANSPQYVETVPRRGYRFIAPIIAEIPAIQGRAPADSVVPESSAEPAGSKSHSTPSRMVLLAALAIVIVLAMTAIATVVWLRRPSKFALQEPRHISSIGAFPALSRDGKLLAYMSSIGGGTKRIWVQQTAGGAAIPVTADSYPAGAPNFSPDGTRIAFCSPRNGGGIYIAPTLPGDPRLVLANPSAQSPRFSPSGDRILYWQDQKAFTVSVDGGQPIALPLNQNFRLFGFPIWSASGNEIVFYGVRTREQGKPAAWWIVPLAEGEPRLAQLPGIEQNSRTGDAVRTWIRDANGREWIIYATANQESWRLWRIEVSPQGAIDQNPELVASGNGNLGLTGTASEDGKLAYDIWSSSQSIYQVSISGKGQKPAPTFQMPLPDGGSHVSPSVSRDGKWLTYNSANVGKPNSILLRDLSIGAERLLDDRGRQSRGEYATSISPDGSTVIFERDCKQGKWPDDPESPMPCGFMVAAAGGQPEQICELCSPRGFSSDGSVILLQKYSLTDLDKSRIVSLDLRTKTEKDFLSLPDAPLFHPYFSWDDRWVVFKKSQSLKLNDPLSQILIAPVRGGSPATEAEWIAVTDGRHIDDKPQFSSDGNTLYFTSTRDGNLCIWAQRLDPVTKHPLGPPYAYEHFHDPAGRAGAFDVWHSDLSVARDKMLINLPQVHSDTWITQMQ